MYFEAYTHGDFLSIYFLSLSFLYVCVCVRARSDATLPGSGLDNGSDHLYKITYSSATKLFTVTIDGYWTIMQHVQDMHGIGLDDNGMGRIGFTGSSGKGLYANHIIKSWR